MVPLEVYLVLVVLLALHMLLYPFDMCAITCMSRKGPICGVWFWYHLLSRMVNMVTM